MYRNSCSKIVLVLCLQYFAVTVCGAGDFLCPSLSSSHQFDNRSLPADSAKRLWIEDFRAFRNAVYRNDTAAVKSFFKFPLKGDTWFLVLSEKELQSKSSNEKFGAFAASDFNQYYSKIFPVHFITTLLKIKSEELYSKGAYETVELRENSTTTYKMHASFDKEEQRLSLNLNFNVVEKDEQGEVIDGGESTVIYIFRVLKNGHLQFDKIMLAG